MLSALAEEPRLWQAQRILANWRSPQAAGLSMWWPLRMSAGQFAVEEPCQNAFGTLAANAAWGTDPQYGPALLCAGALAAQRIDGPAVNFSAPLTLAVWCRPDFTNATTTRAFAKLFSKPHTTAGSDPFVLLALGTDSASPAHWTATISTGGAGSAVSVTSPSVLTANVLFHVAVTYDGSTLCLYANGVLESQTATTLTLGSNAVAFTVGTHGSTGGNNFWGGLILEVRWYTRAISDVDIWQLYDPATRWDLYAPVLMPPFRSGVAITPPLFSLQPRILVVT